MEIIRTEFERDKSPLTIAEIYMRSAKNEVNASHISRKDKEKILNLISAAWHKLMEGKREIGREIDDMRMCAAGIPEYTHYTHEAVVMATQILVSCNRVELLSESYKEYKTGGSAALFLKTLKIKLRSIKFFRSRKRMNIKNRNDMRHIESDIQKMCVRWFRLQYPRYAPLLFAVPNGGRRGKVTAAVMKGEGVVAGVSDHNLDSPRHAEILALMEESLPKLRRYVSNF